MVYTRRLIVWYWEADCMVYTRRLIVWYILGG